LHASASALR